MAPLGPEVLSGAPYADLPVKLSELDAAVAAETKSPKGMEGHSLRAIVELIHELKLSSDLFQLADTTLFNLMGHLGTPRAALWLLPSESSQEPVLVTSQGFQKDRIKAIGSSCAQELSAHFAKERSAFDLEQRSEILSSLAISLALSNGIALFAPLTTRERLTGWVALGQKVSGERYDEYQREMLTASLDMLAVALENTMLFNRLQENNRNLRQANEDLQELDRLKSDFMANMNHELRTPLTIIVAYLQTLLDEEVDAEVRREHLQLAIEESDRLKGLITQLLEFSASRENRLEIRPEFGDLGCALRGYYALRSPGIRADLREFSLRVEPDTKAAYYDEKRFNEVLDALVDNAVKFCPRGSQIRLRLSQQLKGAEVWARVDVEDNGPGIPKEAQANLFEAFRQVDGSSTRDIGGLGMGLALAKRYMELMGGRLQMQSEPGMGTIFSLYFKTRVDRD
jgi:signal transduction histidine kinase